MWNNSVMKPSCSTPPYFSPGQDGSYVVVGDWKGTGMNTSVVSSSRQHFILHWQPNRDLVAIGVSWLLVVAALYTATSIVGQEVWGGMGYFLLYGLVACAL